MQAMLECEQSKILSGFIGIDDASLGAEKSGTPGRGAEGKTLFAAAVQTTSQGQPQAIKLQIIDGFHGKSIENLAKQFFVAGSTIISDGLKCFNAVSKVGCEHDRIVCGGGKASVQEPEFY